MCLEICFNLCIHTQKIQTVLLGKTAVTKHTRSPVVVSTGVVVGIVVVSATVVVCPHVVVSTSAVIT